MKTHFLVSESPQKFDQSIQALCGKTLANPQPVIEIEVGCGIQGLVLSSADCGKCVKKIWEIPVSVEPAYLYGLIEAQEAMHSGDTLEKLEKSVEAKI